MEAHTAEKPVDVQDFQFKLQRDVQIFIPTLQTPATKVNLVAASSVYGIVFVGAPDKTLHILRTKDIIGGTGNTCLRRIFSLPSIPIHISLNCNNEYLSVVLRINDNLKMLVYQTKAFLLNNPTVFQEIQLSSLAHVNLSNLVWNPCQEDSVAVCTTDGMLAVFQCKSNAIDLQTKATNARCLSWSPKGKQIVTGNSDGTLSQYKPDLSLVKIIPAPKFNNVGVSEVIAIHWISNYQFCVVYNDLSENESRTCVTIVNTPKTGTNFVNYEDICYSMDASREANFYLIHLASWGIILASSANSMEIGVLGSDDQLVWRQWCQMDEARAELPLTKSKQENYPVGICFDYSATVQLPWGEGQTLPFMPMIHILSHTGLLVTYFLINVSKNSPEMCKMATDYPIPKNLLTDEISINKEVEVLSTVKSSPPKEFSFTQNLITSTPMVAKSDRNVMPSNNHLLKQMEQIKEENDKKTPMMQMFPNNFANQSQIKIPSFPVNETASLNSNNKEQQKEPLPATIDKKIDKTYKPSIQTVPNEIIKSMLIKEINNFQKELHELIERCQKLNIEIGSEEEMNKIATVLSDNDKHFKISFPEQDIKNKLSYIKHNLIKTCAFIAEAKMQPVSMEFEQLIHLDPVSSEKMAILKSSIYYIESQLERINGVLDEQWEIFESECKKKIMALHGIEDKDYMKIPTLDKIYQPLLKQSDILIKQQKVIASLEKTIENMGYSKETMYPQSLTDCEPTYSSMPCLTKNLLNLSIQSNVASEPVDSIKLNEKNNYLRKILKDYNTVVIKPTKVETPSIFQSWETLKEKLPPPATVISQESKTITINANNFAQIKKEYLSNTLPKPMSEPTVIFRSNENNSLSTLSNLVSNIANSNNQINVTKPIVTKAEKPSIINVPVSVPITNIIPENNVNPKPFPDMQNISINFQQPVSKFSFIPKVPTTASTMNAPVPQTNILSTKQSVPIAPATISTSAIVPIAATTTAGVFNISNTGLIANVPVSNMFSKLQPTSTTVAFPTLEKPNSIENTQSNNTIMSPLKNIPNITLNTVANNTNFNFKVSSEAPKIQFPPSINKTEENAPIISPVKNVINDQISKNTPAVTSNAPIQSSKIFNVSFPSSLSVVATTDNKPQLTSPSEIFSVKNTLPVISNEKIANPEIKNDNLTFDVKTAEAPSNITKPINVPSTTVQSVSKNVFNIGSGISSPSASTSIASIETTQSFTSSATIVPQVTVTSNTSPVFVTPTQPSISPTFAIPKSNEAPVFGTAMPTTTANTNMNVFGSPNMTNALASSLFGAANAAIDTSVVNLFGNSSITSETTSIFKSPTQPANNVFGGGSSVFGSQTSFTNKPETKSLFGGGSSTFGQSPPTNIFGGSPSFGGFGANVQASNVFGQATQSVNTFNTATNVNENPFGKSSFGSPTTQQSSIFGSAPASAPVFGGSPTFGSKPTFGQSASFGSPSSTFGMFTSSQPSVEQTGFGVSKPFGKPAGFTGSPEFATAPVFGSSPTFGTSSNFGSFGSTGFGMNTQQSSTFENIASQSSLSFGNLAQQTQPPSSAFQGSPAFSNWR